MSTAARLKSVDATVVSLFPFKIVEKKPAMIPPEFVIPAAAKDDFVILNVGICNTYIYMDAERGSMPFPEFAGTVADSIVNDFIMAQLEYRDDNCKPGLFWVPGKHTKEDIKKNFAAELAAAKAAQINWFKRLVYVADDSWNRVKKHSEISDVQREAVRQLNIKRDWLIDYTPSEDVKVTA